MPNKNYQRGVRLERAIIAALNEDGYVSLRTAGSHGFADVIAINQHFVRLVQAKVTKVTTISLATYKADLAKILSIKCPENCMRELWVKIDGKKPYKVLIL